MNEEEGAVYTAQYSYQTVQRHCVKTTMKTFRVTKQKISVASKLDRKLGLLKVRLEIQRNEP